MLKSRFLDEIRRRIQQVLSPPDTVSSSSEPETEEDWLNYFEEFDWQLENAPTITVRERIGNPLLRPINFSPAAESLFRLGRRPDLTPRRFTGT